MRLTPLALPLATVLLALDASAQVTFTDLAASAGIDDLSFGRGASMADLDGDGLQDLVAINAGMRNHFYRQLPGGTFVETSTAWGLVPDTRQHWAGLVADFDNDGDEDVYVATGGFMFSQTNQVLRNDLATTGTLTDVSLQSGDGDIQSQNFGATAQDFDNDGDLDIFVTTNDAGSANLLLSNEGNLSFKEVGAFAGIVHTGMFMHTSSGDFDSDGWPDVGAGSYLGNSVIYRNKGDGTFAEVASLMGVDSPKKNFGLVFEDFDNDGLLDLFVPKYNATLPATLPTELYINDGVNSFLKVPTSIGLTAQTDMGHNVADLDGDGFPDIYIGTGNPAFKGLDLLLKVTPSATTGLAIQDISASSGVLAGGQTRCHGMAIGDYDGDGMLDVFVNNGGPSNDVATLEAHYLLKAADNGTTWAGAELEGRLSNRSAVGAHLIGTTETGRQVHRRRAVGTGFGNTNSPVLHLGLGSASALTQLEIRWPSGIVQTLVAPAVGQVHQVTETGMLLDGQPSTGATLDLALCGPADQIAELYFSPFPFELALPGLGQLGILPPLTTLGGFPLDADGLGQASIPIPAGGALAGVSLYLQSWFHDPVTFANPQLSNVVPVTIP